MRGARRSCRAKRAGNAGCSTSRAATATPRWLRHVASATWSDSTTYRPCSSAVASVRWPTAADRVRGGGRRSVAVCRRRLRRGAFHLRRDVRAEAGTRGRRASARRPPGRHDRAGQLDSGGLHRNAAGRGRSACSAACRDRFTNPWSALGFRIAIDDVGAGQADSSIFSQLEPEFVTLASRSFAVSTAIRRKDGSCSPWFASATTREKQESPREWRTLASGICWSQLAVISCRIFSGRPRLVPGTEAQRYAPALTPGACGRIASCAPGP